MFTRNKNSDGDGFQPMEMDASDSALFDEEDGYEDEYSYVNSNRGGGGGGGRGKKKRKKWSCCYMVMCFLATSIVVIAGGGAAYYYFLMMGEQAEDKNNSNTNNNISPSNGNEQHSQGGGGEEEAITSSPSMAKATAATTTTSPTTTITTTMTTSSPTINENTNNNEEGDGEEDGDADGEEEEEVTTMSPTTAADATDSSAVSTSSSTSPTAANDDNDNDNINNNNNGDDGNQPPMAYRDEERVIFLGKSPPNWQDDIPRQSKDSQYELIDPPIVVSDPYGWLRHSTVSTGNPPPDEIMDYIHAENNYTTQKTMHLNETQNELFHELINYIEETYHTLPQPGDDGYYYYRRTIQGKPYPLHCRAPVVVHNKSKNSNDMDGDIPDDDGVDIDVEEANRINWLAQQIQNWDGNPTTPILPDEVVWLDENELAGTNNDDDNNNDEESSSSHLDVGDIAFSSDGTLVAYTIDDTGNEIYKLIIEDLENNKVVLWGGHGVGYDDVSPTVIFGKERTTLFIVKSDDAQRDSQAYICQIHFKNDENGGFVGSDPLDCQLLYEEHDIEYWVSISKTLDEEYLLVETASSDTSEVWYLDLGLAESLLNNDNEGGDDDNNNNSNDISQYLTRIAHRRSKVLYSIDHGEGMWWMLSNIVDEKIFDLYYSPIGEHDFHSVTKPISNDENDGEGDGENDGEGNNSETNPAWVLHGQSLESVTALRGYLIVEGRQLPEGIPQIWILKLKENDDKKIYDDEHEGEITEEDNPVVMVVPVLQQKPNQGGEGGSGGGCHTISFFASANGSFETSKIIVEYESLVTPMQYIAIDIREEQFEIPVVTTEQPTPKTTLLMENPVDGYDKTKYECQRILVPAHRSNDETATESIMIPVSLVYMKSTFLSVTQQSTPGPMHLYAYGAYGVSIDDTFRSSRLPLLDRGIIYAIAHVRGGGELGQGWYDDGKLLNKKHTFDDLIDVAHYFIDIFWTTADLLSIEGRSAGGLTIGAVVNEAPELFRAAILGVPFVDVLATMSDASIPLTALEWLEWGNPNEEEFYEYMKSYSPVNNVRSIAPSSSSSSTKIQYPSMMILAGLYDPRVAYWEPAKLTATLRHNGIGSSEEDERPVLLHTDMTSGHFSASDRYKHLEGTAREYAYLLDQLGIL